MNKHEHTVADFDMGGYLGIPKTKELFGKEHTPAIILTEPKYAHNVGTAIRMASCFGAKVVIFTGDRIDFANDGTTRLPREERMRGYKDVIVLHDDYPFNRFTSDVTPVALEMKLNSEPLTTFEHPEYPVYVFGPEDGSISRANMGMCHRFVVVPSKHCLNLASAVGIVLYDRMQKIGITNHTEIGII
jgi:tRNA(Leu) C34 or U34 (ribose-2'-O)-methylase TrmL